MSDDSSLFKQLYNLDISKLISTLDMRGGIDYIEWAEAWKTIKEFDGDASFEVLENSEGLPFFDSKYGVFVKVKVTVKLHSITEVYAVDEKQITAQAINNATQRALVKALGRLGFGLQLWISEERERLKQERMIPPKQAAPQTSVRQMVEEINQQKISEPQRIRLRAIATEMGWKDDEVKALLKRRGYDSSKDIKKSDYDNICNQLKDPTEKL